MCAMPKATITLPDGTLITVEGDPEEINRVLRLYSGGEEAKAAAEKGPRRRVSIVWWIVSVVLLSVLVLGGICLYSKLNSLSGTLDQAVTAQAASAATQRAGVGLAPSMLRPTSASMAGCSATKSCTYHDMTLCFLQVGAEGDWRAAMTNSIKQNAEKLGVRLIFSDAQAVQQNQISNMRDCIQKGVNVIALVPVVGDGWEAVLTEAMNANIPVILVDRTVIANPSLYTTHIGSNMELEGERAAAELNRLLPNGGTILEISGTIGSSAAVARARGFRGILNANITILDSQTADFTRVEALPVMQAFLKKYKAGKDFQGIFVHNDDMGVGVIAALKEAGIKPGELFIVSVDGSRSGIQALVDGWFQADVECNPLLGPQVFELALKLMNGFAVDREVPAIEGVYHQEDALKLMDHSTY